MGSTFRMNNETASKKWLQLGLDKEYLDLVAKNIYTRHGMPWHGGPSWNTTPPPPTLEAESWTFEVLHESRMVFALGWLGYFLAEPPLNDWREAGRRIVSATTYYFFGPWRENFVWNDDSGIGYAPINREQARTRLPWINAYRAGLALACAFSDWTSVDELLEWPGSDLCYDEGTDDRTKEDNAYYIWLAMRLRDEPEEKAATQRELVQQPKRREGNLAAVKAFQKVKDVLPGVEAIASAAIQREMIERGSRRRPKMLMAAANALLDGNAAEFGKSLAAYLKHYRQKELQTQRVDTGICLDGMVLWHLARHRGLGEIPLPDDLAFLIAKP